MQISDDESTKNLGAANGHGDKTIFPGTSPSLESWFTNSESASDNSGEVREFLERLNITPEALQKLQGDYRQNALLNLGVMAGVYFKFEVADSAPSAQILDIKLAVNASTYVRHDSFESFWNLVEPAGGIAVISAPPHHGRTALAYAILSRLRYKGLVDEAHRLTFGGSDTLPGKRIPREPGRAYMLELPPDEQAGDGEVEFSIKDDFSDHLANLRDLLKRRQSRLIVLTRPDQWNRITSGAPIDFSPDFGKPPLPVEIARKALRIAYPHKDIEPWLADSRILKLFENAHPIDAVDIADLVASELRYDDDLFQQRTFEHQVDNVVNARSSWRQKLLAWHKDPTRTAIERNFLLAASVLRDAPISHIYAKAADLCTAFCDSPLKLSGQSAPGIIELLASVEAIPTQTEKVRFHRPHWEDAAIEYFWIDRPLSRQTFVKWLADTPLGSSHGDLVKISQDESIAIGQRVVEFAVKFAVRHERHMPLTALAEAWHGQKRLWQLLVDAIDTAAVTETSSPYIRKMLLEWAKASEPSRQKLVAAVCAQNFGAVHTGFALRRLRHIGDSCAVEVFKDLQNAIRHLWKDEAARVTLLQYLGQWCRMEYAAGRVAFQALAQIPDENSGFPQVLTVFQQGSFSGVAVNVLEIAWRQLLDHSDLTQADSSVERCINFWMTSALDDEIRKGVFSVLKAAASGAMDPRPSIRREALRGFIQRWVDGDPANIEFRRTLQREFSQVLDAEIVSSARLIVDRENR